MHVSKIAVEARFGVEFGVRFAAAENYVVPMLNGTGRDLSQMALLKLDVGLA